MLSKVKFNRVMHDLDQFGSKGHERLVIRNGILKTKSRGNWIERLIQHFYKPKNERIQNVARVTFHFLKENQDRIDNPDVLQKFVPALHKGKYGSRLENLISDMNESTTELSEVSTVEENNEENQTEQNKILRSYIFGEAIEIANDFGEFRRKIALSRIASEQSKIDLEAATKTARMITDDHWRNDAFGHIAAEIALTDREHALVIVSDMDSEENRNWAYCKIAKKLTTINLQQSIEITTRINHDAPLGKALSEIAMVQAGDDIEEGLRSAREIGNSYDRNTTLQKLSVKLVDVNLERAFEVARTIAEHYHTLTLCKIAAQLIKNDREKALDIVRGFEKSYKRVIGLARLAVAIAEQDLEYAKQLITEAKEIAREDPEHYQISIYWIVRIQRKMDPEGSIEMIQDVEREGSRSELLVKIATTQAKTDLEGALKTARGIEYPLHRATALAQVAAQV